MFIELEKGNVPPLTATILNLVRKQFARVSWRVFSTRKKTHLLRYSDLKCTTLNSRRVGAAREREGKRKKGKEKKYAGNVLRNLFREGDGERERVYQVSRIRPSREMW